jgi:hypothetical protein
MEAGAERGGFGLALGGLTALAADDRKRGHSWQYSLSNCENQELSTAQRLITSRIGSLRLGLGTTASNPSMVFGRADVWGERIIASIILAMEAKS